MKKQCQTLKKSIRLVRKLYEDPPDIDCQKDKNYFSLEQCSKGCPFNYELICASNGKSYDNRCLMKVDACETQSNIEFVHYGPCGKFLLHK